MTVRIGSNISSLNSQRLLAQNTDAIAQTYERLASGMRINRASDDAAGLAIASSLNSDTRVYTQGIRNFNDGLSLLSIAQGALQELSKITQSQYELAQQAANGTYSFSQRLSLHRVNSALISEFNRIIQAAEFNGIQLLDGSLTSGVRFQGGYGVDGSIFASVGGELSRTAGDGTFTGGHSFATAATGVYDILTGDFNNDGIEDLAGASWTNGSWVSLGNGDGTFRAAITTTGSAQTQRIMVGDFNGDGRDDIIRSLSGSTSEVLIGNGDGTFSLGQQFTFAGGASPGGQVADFDGDGILDYVGNDQTSGAIYMFRGNGNGTFASGVTIGSAAFQNRSAIGDINGDGRIDLVVNYVSGTRVLLNQGGGVFTSSLIQSGNIESGSLADVNGDGILDLLTTAGGGADSMSVFIGNGNGTFQASRSYSFAIAGLTLDYQDIKTGDVNGDGIPDAVIALRNAGTSTGTVAVFLANADGTFGAVSTIGAVDNSISVTLGDFNRDGVTDFAAGIAWGTVRVYNGDTREITSIARQDLTTQENARNALNILSDQLTRISGELGAIGALQSRMQVAINNLSIARENFAAASSRITDIDVASESAELVRRTILQKSAAAILAQANIQPKIALSLLADSSKAKK